MMAQTDRPPDRPPDGPFTHEHELRRIGEGMFARTLPVGEWTHAAHWAAALWIIARRPDLHPPSAMPGLIRSYNEACGNENTATSGYHDTITQASLRAGRAVLAEAAPDEPLWRTLNRLLAAPLGRSDWLKTWWTKDILMSSAARRAWTEPDRAPFPYPAFPGPIFPDLAIPAPAVPEATRQTA